MQIHSSLSPVWLVSVLFCFQTSLIREAQLQDEDPLFLHTWIHSLQALPFFPQLKMKGTNTFLTRKIKQNLFFNMQKKPQTNKPLKSQHFINALNTITFPEGT